MRPLFLALFITAAASAQPFLLGPERTTHVRPGISCPSQNMIGTASDGTNQLVVWRDDRNIIPAHSFNNEERMAIVAARVDGQGNVLDVPNLVLPMQAGGKVLPFWNGHEYVVVAGGLYVRISASGELLDRQARTFKSLGPASAIAWAGDRLMIVFRSHAMVYDASFNVVRDDFVVADHEIIETVAASNGNGFIVSFVTQFQRGVSVIAFDRNGAVVREQTLLAGELAYEPRIASDGERYLFVVRTTGNLPYLPGWNDYNFVQFTLNGEGVVIGGGGTLGKAYDFESPVDLQWQGDRYALVFYTGSGVNTMTFDRDGGPAGSVKLVSGFPHSLMVSGAGPHMLFWSVDTPKSSTHLEWHLVSGQPYSDPATFAATTAQRFILGQGSLSQETPAVATAGDISLLIWRERESARGPLALYAARVDRYGRVVGAPAVLIADVTCDVFSPAVAANGSDFLVVWQDGRSIRARRVGHDGRPLDPAAITLSDDEKECTGLPPQAVWNGSKYLVTWGSVQTPANKMTLRSKRIGADGTLLDLSPILFATRNFGEDVIGFRTASDDHDFMIGWAERLNAFVMRVTNDGLPYDIGGIALDGAGMQDLFWTGTHYVALLGSGYQRFTAGGQPVDLTRRSFPFRTMNLINCDASGCAQYDLTDGMINVTRIVDTSAGLLTETKPFARADATTLDWRPLLFFGEAPLVNAAYLRMAPEPPYAGSWHLFVRPALAPRGRSVR